MPISFLKSYLLRFSESDKDLEGVALVSALQQSLFEKLPKTSFEDPPLCPCRCLCFQRGPPEHPFLAGHLTMETFLLETNPYDFVSCQAHDSDSCK